MTDDTPSDETESLWIDTTPETSFAPLDGDRSVDVAVVGGGIVGLTAADRLKAAGKTVAVVEADRIVEGVTGKTTAKVTAQHGLVYADLVDRFGEKRARQYARANQHAVETIADRVEADGIDCGFERTPAYTYVRSRDDRDAVKDEVAAARNLGLPASFVESTPLPFETAAAIRVDDQAQFHPREYLLSVADDVDGEGSHVFEQTKATSVEGGQDSRVETTRGTVVADDVVVATHFPLVDGGRYFTRMRPKRSYVMAVRLNEDPPVGMFYEPSDPYFSVRTHRIGDVDSNGTEGSRDERLVLFGGQDHKTGHEGDARERYRRLEAHVRERFDVASVEYQWSTQDYVTADSVPYVGELGPATEHVYVATGFGGWGMTNGTAAGTMLAERILTGSHEWADVFDPARFTPSSVPTLVRENVHAGKEFFEGWLAKLNASDVESLDPGEATVLREGGTPTGVYRDDEGRYGSVSAVCTHTNCIVEWNDAEKSWDCPCHGSRFEPDGAVIDGPATEPLSAADLPESLRRVRADDDATASEDDDVTAPDGD